MITLLTTREQEVAALVAKGFCNKKIARALGCREGTVKIHLHNSYQKLNLINRTQLAAAWLAWLATLKVVS
jgi:DNA-binding NarL/FixJ family response regulator